MKLVRSWKLMLADSATLANVHAEPQIIVGLLTTETITSKNNIIIEEKPLHTRNI